MNCKNCGTKVSDSTKICPNCGSLVDENDGYILLTDEAMDFEDYDSGRTKKKKGSGFIWFISILLTLAIIGGGAYYYFTNIYEKEDPRPPLTFETGSGVINGNEQIIYATIENGEKIEFIHGVRLYDFDTSTIDETPKPVSTEYQYTKSINDSFRAIFFDTKSLELGKKNTYTFEMDFSFSGSSDVYTYTTTVNFDKQIKGDVSDIIFDHSVDEVEVTEESDSTTETTEELVTVAEKDNEGAGNTDFIYNSYWYSEPQTDGDKLTIYCYKFEKSGKYTATKYYKDGDKDWVVTTENGDAQATDFSVTINGTEYLVDTKNQTISADDGKKLNKRNYNSIENTKSFFKE